MPFPPFAGQSQCSGWVMPLHPSCLCGRHGHCWVCLEWPADKQYRHLLYLRFDGLLSAWLQHRIVVSPLEAEPSLSPGNSGLQNSCRTAGSKGRSGSVASCEQNRKRCVPVSEGQLRNRCVLLLGFTVLKQGSLATVVREYWRTLNVFDLALPKLF